jgi:hypothetical protein
METKKDYKNYQLGFDRTQLFKEETHPQIIRMSALTQATAWVTTNKMQITQTELFALVGKYQKFIETGDISWIVKVDLYFEKKYEID